MLNRNPSIKLKLKLGPFWTPRRLWWDQGKADIIGATWGGCGGVRITHSHLDRIGLVFMGRWEWGDQPA